MIDLTGITNENEFYTHQYLSVILDNDLKNLRYCIDIQNCFVRNMLLYFLQNLRGDNNAIN